MAEELTSLLVLEQLKTLHVAFPSHAGMKSNPQATADVYRDGLHGLSGEALRAATKIHTATGKYFPKIAELRELASEWTRRHRVDIEPELADPMWCPRCASRVQWVQLWRPMVDSHGFIRTTPDDEYVLLERTARHKCKCASPNAYWPDDEHDTPMMRADRIKWRQGRPPKRKPSQLPPFIPPPAKEPLTPNVGAIAEQLVESVAVQTEEFAHV